MEFVDETTKSFAQRLGDRSARSVGRGEPVQENEKASVSDERKPT